MELIELQTLDDLLTPGARVAIGLDFAASEDNWGLCVLVLREALDDARMALLLPTAERKKDGEACRAALTLAKAPRTDSAMYYRLLAPLGLTSTSFHHSGGSPLGDARSSASSRTWGLESWGSRTPTSILRSRSLTS